MTEKIVRTVKAEPRPLSGFKGKVSAITYGHSIKIGMPNAERYAPNHALDVHFSMTVEPSEEDDWTMVQSALIMHVHQTIEVMSEERLNYWREMLGLNRQ